MNNALEARHCRLKVLLELSKEGELSHENKVKFREDLDTIIAAGVEHVEERTLAWAYNLRGMVHAGWHPNVCEKAKNVG